jgi:hypothetical protein
LEKGYAWRFGIDCSMAERKKRSYRKKKVESDDEASNEIDQSTKSESGTPTASNVEDIR